MASRGQEGRLVFYALQNLLASEAGAVRQLHIGLGGHLRISIISARRRATETPAPARTHWIRMLREGLIAFAQQLR